MSTRFFSPNAKVGSELYIKKTLVSSAITQAGVDVTGAATDALWIEDVILQTGATGLATATNFTLGTTNANGATVNLSTVVSGLGANKTVDFANASVTKLKGVLEAGKKVVAKATTADATGAGTIDIYIKFRRLADGATVKAA
jgi:hypothetical protein